jgi:hypothetical protein
VVIKTSHDKMITPQEPPHTAQPLWPWIVMPAIVLIVFCILHFDVRPRWSLASTPTTMHSENSPSE